MTDTKWLIIILMLLMGATSVHAAGETIDPQLQAEIAKETGAAPANNAVTAVPVQKQLAAPAGASTVVVPTQVIVNPAQAQVAPANVQQQPTTYVEASPLVQSRADQLRKMRQDAEVGTEQKLVEKIEASRLDDEQKRARKLFGDQNFSADTPQPQQQPLPPQNVYLVPPPPPVAPAPLAAPQQSPEEIKADIVQSVKADLAKEEEEKKSTRYYFSAGAGVADYSDATNISNQSSFGGSIGMMADNGAVVDLGLNYGNYYISRGYWGPWYMYQNLDQYNIWAAAKYNFLPGRLRPMAGAVLSYTYRKYQGKVAYINQNFGSADSGAFDWGLTAGVDFDLTKNMAVGVDYKYMMNMWTRQSYEQSLLSGNRLETFNYSILSLVIKFLF